jgi:hypothetical protein
MYTVVLIQFEAFQAQVAQTSPAFKDPAFVRDLTTQIEQLRGRELPGFMSSQAFYMCMSQYVEQWQAPTQLLLQAVREVAAGVSLRLTEVSGNYLKRINPYLHNTYKTPRRCC